MASSQHPLESRYGAALLAVSALDGRLERDARTAIKLYFLKRLHELGDSKEVAEDEVLLAAFERFHKDANVEALGHACEIFINEVLDIDSGAHIVGRVPIHHSGTIDQSPSSPARIVHGSHDRLTGPFARARAMDFGSGSEVRFA